LRSIAKEAGEDGETSGARGAIGRMGGRDQKKVEEDYELFLRDLEEDPELRSGINLYKATDARMAPPDVEKKSSRRKVQYAMEVDEPGPVVEQPSSTVPGANVEEEEEPDFPEVNMNELLEGFDELTLGPADGEETDSVQNEGAKRRQIEALRGQLA